MPGWPEESLEGHRDTGREESCYHTSYGGSRRGAGGEAAVLGNVFLFSPFSAGRMLAEEKTEALKHGVWACFREMWSSTVWASTFPGRSCHTDPFQHVGGRRRQSWPTVGGATVTKRSRVCALLPSPLYRGWTSALPLRLRVGSWLCLNPVLFCPRCVAPDCPLTGWENGPFSQVTLTGHLLMVLSPQKPMGAAVIPLPRILHGAFCHHGFRACRHGHGESIVSSRSAQNTTAETLQPSGLYSLPVTRAVLSFLNHFAGFLLVSESGSSFRLSLSDFHVCVCVFSFPSLFVDFLPPLLLNFPIPLL